MNLPAEEQIQFALEYVESKDPYEAYKAAFPSAIGAKAEIVQKAKALLALPEVSALVAKLSKDPLVRARQIYKAGMATGSAANQMKAAKEYLATLGKEDRESDAFARWCEIMQSVGAEIVIPPHEKPVSLSFESFINGEAHISLPLDAKLRLLELAKAPWNDKDPTATVSDLQKEALGREDREMIILGGSGVGKALAPSTNILTPKGWVNHEDLAIGDAVFDERGNVCHVTGLSPVWTTGKWYEVEFDSGEKIKAHERHEWVTHQYKYRKALARRHDDGLNRSHRQVLGPTIVETREIAETLSASHGGKNHAIPVAEPLELPRQELSIDPYVLGAWLGDGSSGAATITLSSDDIQILHEIDAAGVWVRSAHLKQDTENLTARLSFLGVPIGGDLSTRRGSLQGRLRDLDLLNNKHIPTQYLTASVDQRLALLQGLMDTDGYVNKTGTCQFYNTNERLAVETLDLVRSLGIKATLTSKKATCNGKDCGLVWMVTFTTVRPVFRLKRKLQRIPNRVRSTQQYHYIVAAREIVPEQARCIEVSSSSHLYLAGKSLVPTHNSALGGMFGLCELLIPGRQIAVVAAIYKHVGHEFDYIVQGFKNLFPNMLWETAAPVCKNINRTKYEVFHISTIWKTEARGYSTDTQEGAALLGSGFDLVICGEGDLIPYGIYNRKIKRAMDRRAMRTGPGHRTGRVAMFTTPAFGEGAASRIRERVFDSTNGAMKDASYPSVSWAESTWVREATVLENPAYDREVYEATKKIMLKEDPDAFYEQYEGKIRKRSGVVLKEFDRERHIIEMPSLEHRKMMRFVIGIDPGSRFGAVLIGMDQKGKKFICGEVYNEKQTVSDNVSDLKEICVHVLSDVVEQQPSGDIELDFENVRDRIDSIWVDRASEQKLELEEALDTNLDFGQFEVSGTISTLREMFGTDELFVVDECEQWIKDAGRYIYKTKKGLDVLEIDHEPRKQHDHLCDATRYAIFGGLEMAGPLEARDAPVGFNDAYDKHIRESLLREMQGEPQNPLEWMN